MTTMILMLGSTLSGQVNVQQQQFNNQQQINNHQTILPAPVHVIAPSPPPKQVHVHYHRDPSESVVRFYDDSHGRCVLTVQNGPTEKRYYADGTVRKLTPQQAARDRYAIRVFQNGFNNDRRWVRYSDGTERWEQRVAYSDGTRRWEDRARYADATERLREGKPSSVDAPFRVSRVEEEE